MGGFGKAIALGVGHLHDFDNLDEARAVIGAFIERYNNGWLLQRHGREQQDSQTNHESRRFGLVVGGRIRL